MIRSVRPFMSYSSLLMIYYSLFHSILSYWIGGWVGPKDGLDDVEKRKFLNPPGLELRLLVVQPIGSRYTGSPGLVSTTKI
jgi:hypothetical protein